VNEAFVRTHLRGLDPLTVTMSVWMRAENPYAPIIGVVADVNEGSVKNDALPTVFYSDRQLALGSMTLFVRTKQPPSAAAAVNAIRQLDANLAVTRVRTFEGALAESLARERLNALVSGAFAVVGLLLASLGLYGLLAFLVTERTREIGIRIALGADSRRLTRSVIASGLRLVGIGTAVGVLGALLVLQSLEALLFGVTPHDALTYAVVVLLLGAVAAVASYIPARAAARVEPLRALRQD
jgi:ABC-type antimicrobial peptide transport system permease subunit